MLQNKKKDKGADYVLVYNSELKPLCTASYIALNVLDIKWE